MFHQKINGIRLSPFCDNVWFGEKSIIPRPGFAERELICGRLIYEEKSAI
jgi:hypothetical protein